MPVPHAFDRAERDNWAGRAGAYAETFGTLCAHTAQPLLDAAGVGPGTRVLDAGTGPGTLAAAARARGAEVSATDADADMADLARTTVPDADVRVAALPELPFPDGAFDAVTANFVLNHVSSPRTVLAALRRVARPGGLVAVTVWAAPGAPGQALLWRAVEAAGYTPAPSARLDAAEDFARTPDGLTALLQEAGFRDATARLVEWDHVTTPAAWWAGPAAGIATIGREVTSGDAARTAAIHRAYLRLAEPFARPDRTLALPHRAVLAAGRA
ncbi:class I SAM-dependent methyltransferase [Streptomyces sp. NPDC060194]|uniref:class I SAM-dependent methyltransferase n=1 Tax=Streptomyces sp. NPDC060194 TaxID=3347069 RepID=UPI00365AE57A